MEYPRIDYAVARVYPKTIDRINIARAANLAALRAYRKLITRYETPGTRYQVYLDGGLYLGNGRGKASKRTLQNGKVSQQKSAPLERLRASTLIRGDEKIKAIKIASIVAKVSRDRYMTRLTRKYPWYGFHIHKGYGTKLHRQAIKRHGPSTVHRLTFIKRYHRI